jgi:hypothetical protein
MPPISRKRSSAFEDFSEAEKNQSVTAVTLPGSAEPRSTPLVERIERLKPSQMLPDRFQPRRLLPATIRQKYYSQQIDCYQAASQWIELAKKDSGYQSEIDQLLAMGGSFEEHGQIKPITGSWSPSSAGQFIFTIETGERRFWAACFHRIADNQEDEPLLRVEVIENPSRYRQVLENRHSEIPSAVGQACEVASLILTELKMDPDNLANDEFEYFRMVRAQRMPAGLWERIMPVMQLTRPRMVQLLNILQLPTPLLDLADRYRVPERVLREVLSLPQDQWGRILQLSIQENLTSDDLAAHSTSGQGEKEAAKHPGKQATLFPGKIAVSGLRRFVNVVVSLDPIGQEQALDEVADELVGTGEAEGVIKLLGELANLVNMRLSRQ